MASAAAAEEEATLEALAYTLIRITSLLLLGYVSARHLLPPGAQSGISAFVGTLALPALLFSSIAILQWDAVDWTIVAAVMLAKALTLACCVGVGVLITPRPAHAGAEILNGAVLALLAVSSDDLGLGLPVMSALYGRGSRYVSQLFVIVPLHNLLVNPALLSLLAFGCAQRRSSAGGGRAELGPILRGVLRGLAGNPLVLAVLAGLATNLAGDTTPNLPLHLALDHSTTHSTTHSTSHEERRDPRCESLLGTFSEPSRNLLGAFSEPSRNLLGAF